MQTASWHSTTTLWNGSRPWPPDGVDHVTEVAAAAHIKRDLAVCRNQAVIAACTTDADPVSIPPWELLFKNITLKMLGSDDFSADTRDATVTDLTAASADGALAISLATPLPLSAWTQAHNLVEA